MADFNKPIASSFIKQNEPNDRRYEPKTKFMVWWGLAGLAAFAIIVGVIYDMGDGTRTTAPASSTALPMGQNTPSFGP